MKKRDNVSEIFNGIMSNENYIDSVICNIKDVRTSIDLYLASIDGTIGYDEALKLRVILDESRAIVKAIELV